MNIKITAIIGVVVVLGWLMFSNEKLDPIYFSGEAYENIETNRSKSNKVVNIYYTPNGESMKSTTKFINIFSAKHPSISESTFQKFKQRSLQTWGLKPIAGSTKRYFGMYKDRLPVHALEKDKVFIIHMVRSINTSVKKDFRSQANQTIDAMDNISLAHLY